MPVPAAPGSTSGSNNKAQTIGNGGSSVSPNGGRPGGTSPSKTEQATENVAVSLKFGGSGEASATQRYPLDLRADKNTDYVRFDFYEYEPPFGANAKTGGSGSSTDFYNSIASSYKQDTKLGNIILYMPEDISTGYKANWSGKNFSNIGAGIMKSAGEKDIGSFAASMIDTTADAVGKAPAIIAAQVVNAAIGKITGESVSLDEFFGSTRGVILNPNSELLFSGFDMRNFSLNYKLVPRNASEANSVEKIIRTFKQAMLPSANSGAGPSFSIDVPGFGGPQNAGFIKVPSVCKVSFMRGSSLNPDVPQYKHCALTQVDVSYTPDGVYATTEDGKMVAYQLSLNFQETKLIYRDEISSSGATY